MNRLFTKYYYLDGTNEVDFDSNPDKILHRVDGPALYNAECEYYYFAGKLHRINGPAVIIYSYSFDKKQYFVDYKQWFFNGVQSYCFDQNEFDKFVSEQISSKNNINKVKVK